ncbi:hypothetical protein AVEN_152473-1 [Araneus ventricosus]|uniref:Uncharacterized protein n=1 Tax=Araneus ventricosus TaxID=182803 RepID=A0A4Y2SAK6_ARAVE|nr:hypothetical protein AVEN_152473-1 [Araneus ventricosus]
MVDLPNLISFPESQPLLAGSSVPFELHLKTRHPQLLKLSRKWPFPFRLFSAFVQCFATLSLQGLRRRICISVERFLDAGFQSHDALSLWISELSCTRFLNSKPSRDA